jgi:hypothetical protein
LQINIIYDPSTATAPSGFFTAVNEAVSYIDSLVSNNITITLEFGWGQSGPINGDNPADGAISEPLWFDYNPSSLANTQSIITALNAAYAQNGLSTAVTPALLVSDFVAASGSTTLGVNVAQALALGLTTGTAVTQYVALNPTLNWNFDVNGPTNSNFDDAVAVLLHEITHDLGRTAGYAPDSFTTVFDMFRYNASGQLQLTPGGGFFSLNGSVLTLPFEAANLDAADWAASVVGDADGYTQFGNGYDFSITDMLELKALGFQINDPVGAGPVVQTLNALVVEAGSVLASSLFTVSNPLMDNITEYQFVDAGSGGGYFTVHGVIEPDGQPIIVTAANLGFVRYVGGSSPGSETLYVSAFDASTGTWTAQAPLTAKTVDAGPPPVVSVINATVVEGQPVAAATLITSVSNPGGHNLTEYQFLDAGSGGHFTLNGVAQADGSSFVVNVDDLGAVQYVGGSTAGTDSLQIEVFDATTGLWSAPATLTATTAAPPLPNVHNVDANENTAIAVVGPLIAQPMLAGLASYSDPNNDPITQYRFEDTGTDGHFALAGVAQANGAWVTVTAAQLQSLTYVGGATPGTDAIQVEAFDATASTWSAPAALTATTMPSGHVDPFLNLQPVSVAENALTPATSFISSISNPSGDEITAYRFEGRFELNGVVQPDGPWIVVSAAALSELQYLGGSSPGSEAVFVEAYDATAGVWTGYQPQTATTTGPSGTIPSVSVQNLDVAENGGVAATSFVSVSNVGAHNITEYEFFDFGGVGHLTVNGVAQASQQALTVTTANLGTVQFVGGAGPGSDNVAVFAYDATLSSWLAYQVVTATTLGATSAGPTVSAHAATLVEGDTLSATQLITSVSNPSGDSLPLYQLEDLGNGGHFTLNGVTQADGAAFVVSADDLGAVQYVGGSAAGTDTLQIQVYDATTGAWTAPTTLTATTAAAPLPGVQNVDVDENGAITVIGPNTAVPLLARLAGFQDPNNDPITQFRFEDTGTNGHFALAGVAQADGQWVTVTPGQMDSLAYVGGGQPGADSIQVEAFDSVTSTWSAPATLTATTMAAEHVNPVLNLTPIDIAENALAPASSFIGSISNPSGDQITEYKFEGRFELNGIVQPDGPAVIINAGDLGNLKYIGGPGPGSEDVLVEAYDATTSTWTGFATVNATTTAPGVTVPTLTTQTVSVAENGSISASALVSLSNPAGDNITEFAFFNYGLGGGHFDLNGIAQTAEQGFEVAPSNLSSVQYVGGAAPGGETLAIEAFDATLNTWIAWSYFTITTVGPPTILQVFESPQTTHLTAGAQVTFEVAFSEDVTVGGAPTLALSDGGSATYVGGSGGSVLTFAYGATTGENATAITPTGLELGGGIHDLVGNTANVALVGAGLTHYDAIFTGGNGADSLSGTTGAELFIGGGGNDTITGGSGLNTAEYTGDVGQYQIAENGGTLTVTDTVAGRDGTDTLTNVQQLLFADYTVVFDLHSSQDLLVYELYQAAYDRVPDNAGFRYWAGAADANHLTGLQLADQFLSAPEFTQKYGANPTNTQYVTELYTDVLGRAPDPAGLAYWIGQANGGQPRDQLMVDFAISAENVQLIGPHISEGYWTTH